MDKSELFKFLFIIGSIGGIIRGFFLFFNKIDDNSFTLILDKSPIPNRLAGIITIISAIIVLVFALFFYDTIQWK